MLTGKIERQFLGDLYKNQKTKWVVLKSRISVGCIKKYGTNRYQHLYSCLNTLVKRGLIEKSGNRGYYLYRLTEKYHHDHIIFSLKDELDRWDETMLISDFPFDLMMNKEGYSNKPAVIGKNVTWELAGIPIWLWSEIDVDDKKKINTAISNIKYNLESIMQIKLNYLNLDDIKKELNECSGDIEKYEFNVFNIGFYGLVTNWKTRLKIMK